MILGRRDQAIEILCVLIAEEVAAEELVGQRSPSPPSLIENLDHCREPAVHDVAAVDPRLDRRAEENGACLVRTRLGKLTRGRGQIDTAGEAGCRQRTRCLFNSGELVGDERSQGLQRSPYSVQFVAFHAPFSFPCRSAPA